jgi:hypothetical protein
VPETFSKLIPCLAKYDQELTLAVSVLVLGF